MRPSRQISDHLLRLIFPLLSFAFLSTPAPTQSHPTIPPADRKLIAVNATGSQRFTSAEIAAASGLTLGTIADDEDFRKAARQLGESGAFSDISFNYSYSSAGTKLAFQVTDAEKFVPAHFLDFVWFPGRELIEKVHERVPLFHGELPTSGRLPDQVSDVLQALLVEANIPGHVDYLRTESKDPPAARTKENATHTDTTHLASYDYSVANVTIRIQQILFTGAGPDELPQLEAAAEKLSAREYSHALLSNFIDHTILPLYRERGYLKVSCSAPQPKTIKLEESDSPDPNDEHRAITHVDVTIALAPGPRYKVTGWTWLGNQAIPTDTLQSFLHAKPGEYANVVRLEQDLQTIQHAYGARGFVTTTIKANAAYDDAAQSVAFELVVTEGPLFHMGELAFRGIDNALEARLRGAWNLRPGDVYDASYLQEFLPKARKLLPANMDWDVTPHVTAILKDKTVDVDLVYTAKAPQ
jgi:outer membrane protein insertion porin family